MEKLTIAVPLMLALGAACAFAQQADVAVVKSTIAAKKDPGQARGYDAHREAVTRKLEQCGVPFDLLTDEQVIAGKLVEHKLAIFPFNSVTQQDEIGQILKFVEGGGKLMWFYSFPEALGKTLGIGKYSYRGVKYDGEFHTMKFADAPPGFPAAVHQESPNSRIVEEVLPGSRAIALWRDKDGKDTGVPAVVLSPNSLFLSHVLWGNADADQQSRLLLGAICHFIPGKWGEIVNNVLAKAGPEAGYDSLDALRKAAEKPVAREWAEKAIAQERKAREALAARRFDEALDLAKQVQASAQMASAASFPSRPYELRGAWVHPNDSTDWEVIMAALADANFNAVFPIMCGPELAKYPSQYAPQATQRDHMKECLEAARKHGIEVHVWKANWQVLSQKGEVYQKFLDEGRFVLSLEQAMGEKEKSHYQWSARWLDPSEDRNRQLEYDMMMELVEKYHPNGIHFDFMRYPQSNYCYCDRCRQKFQEWAGVKIEQWPQDCTGEGKHVAKWCDWRRHLQTSLVKRIAEGARKIDPNVNISLAARASMTGSYESDAQDWVTWSKEGYLTMLCPMDYTHSVDVLRSKLEPQVAAVDGAVPVYAGIGVSPTRSATPVNLSQQIRLARELGADGFLMFALSPFSQAMLPTVKLGATSAPVTIMPHHRQPVKAVFDYPPGIEGAPKRTYRVGEAVSVRWKVTPAQDDVNDSSVQAFVTPAAGGEEKPVEGEAVALPSEPGIYVVVLRGAALLKDGKEKEVYFRSQPINILTEEQVKELLERMKGKGK
ncbi:MAG: family 10 glycosylhydrolase [Planctomycetota bacterium]